MKLQEHLLVWGRHAAMNFGSGLQCMYHAGLPPQVDHPPEAIKELLESEHSILQEFQYGVGYKRRPRP